jgi:methionyl-tRNA formyltransferase
LLIKTLPSIENGTAARYSQGEAANPRKAYAPIITKDMCRINWSLPAYEIYNFIRGLSETPVAYTFLNGKRLKVYFAEVTDIEDANAQAGQAVLKKDLFAVCGDKKLLKLTDIQLEGGKRMNGKAFLNGNKIDETTILN